MNALHVQLLKTINSWRFRCLLHDSRIRTTCNASNCTCRLFDIVFVEWESCSFLQATNLKSTCTKHFRLLKSTLVTDQFGAETLFVFIGTTSNFVWVSSNCEAIGTFEATAFSCFNTAKPVVSTVTGSVAANTSAKETVIRHDERCLTRSIVGMKQSAKQYLLLV